MTLFVAAAASAVRLEDVNTIAVVLAEGDSGTGRRLEFQIAIAFDGRDVASGEDTYCICTHAGACWYGGVARWHMHNAILELSLTEEAAAELDLDQEVSIELSVSAEAMAEVTEALGGMLGPQHS